MKNLSKVSPLKIRKLIRKNKFNRPTAGAAPGYVQANLVILPRKLAFDFMVFVHRNPKPCPLLEVTEIGNPNPEFVAAEADIRFDLPKYRIYKQGRLYEEVESINNYWQEDFVAFLLGCSFTFEAALLEANIPIRHIETEKNVPMYITNKQCKTAGKFKGPMVVSMRPIPSDLITDTIQITAKYKTVHGTPVQVGSPEKLGIENINTPDFGDPVKIKADEIPVFWACGVTPQAVAMKVKPSIMITHSPGHMFITDLENKELKNY